jgi:hypothetical protein
MRPTREALLKCLPPYQDAWITVHPKQKVKDIIDEILEAHREFSPFYDQIALYFLDDSTEEICKKIYRFLKKNIRYHEEAEDEQTTALPTGILVRGEGDCKHYSSFSGGILDAINRITGRNIRWNYRFASYEWFNKVPHHVFTVVNDDEKAGSEIWIDPTPGSDNKSPVWVIDKKINVSPMALKRNIAGVGVTPTQMVFVEDSQLPVHPFELPAPAYTQRLEEYQADTEVTPALQSAIEVLMHYSVMNDKGEISDSVLKKLSSQLPQNEFNDVAEARQTIQVYIANAVNDAQARGIDVMQALNDPQAIGSLFSDIWRGVKKVTMAPVRNAYLSLVALNAFGYATKLANAIYNKDGTFYQPGQQKLYDKWNSFGGDWMNLHNAIDSGRKKVAILGSIGCGDCSGTVGAAAAALPAWVAIASALIAAMTPLIKEIMATRQQQGNVLPGVDPNTGLPYGMNDGNYNATPGTGGNVIEWIKQNPITVFAIGAAGYFAYTQLKSSR